MRKIIRQSKKNRLFNVSLLILVWLLSVITFLSPFGSQLEENIGLNGLFDIRGERPPPEDIIIISVDRRSADQLNLPTQLRKWPREVYADLLNRLQTYNAQMIGFDIFFREKKNSEYTARFAEAIRASGNVVLFEFLKRDKVSVGDHTVEMETIVKPLSILAEAAAASGIFPLPRVPSKVSQVWMFKPEIDHRATLPVAMYLLANKSLQSSLIRLIEKNRGVDWSQYKIERKIDPINSTFSPRDIRQFFHLYPTLKSNLFTEIKKNSSLTKDEKFKLEQLINTFSSPYSQYLNFYGPRHTITTIPIYKILSGKKVYDLTGKIVFIGFSDKFSTEDKDDFYTLYADGKESLIAGVEIAATQYSNILKNEFVRSFSPINNMILLFVWTVVLISICSYLNTVYLVPGVFAASLIYLAGAYFVFVEQFIWLPLVIPLLLQTLIIGSVFLGIRYLQMQQEKRNIREAFGFYLPSDVISKLEKDAGTILNEGETTFGICLATDVEQYTTLSEKTFPMDLHNLMNRYYQAIFTPVKNKKGYVSDVVGDAMLAIWLNPKSELSIHVMACEAALDIQSASIQFSKENETTPMPTRVGLHCGEIVMGNIGAKGRYEYRAVGDIVNTASRLEGLNKLLGTYILVSGDLIEGLSRIQTRALGCFVLKGKQQPITVYELLGVTGQLSSRLSEKYTQFQEARNTFMQGNISQSRVKFSAIIDEYENDGPSKFYLDMCDALLNPNDSLTAAFRYDLKTKNIYILSK